jgi:hypothetical protein
MFMIHEFIVHFLINQFLLIFTLFAFINQFVLFHFVLFSRMMSTKDLVNVNSFDSTVHTTSKINSIAFTVKTTHQTNTDSNVITSQESYSDSTIISTVKSNIDSTFMLTVKSNIDSTFMTMAESNIDSTVIPTMESNIDHSFIESHESKNVYTSIPSQENVRNTNTVTKDLPNDLNQTNQSVTVKEQTSNQSESVEITSKFNYDLITEKEFTVNESNFSTKHVEALSTPVAKILLENTQPRLTTSERSQVKKLLIQ